MSVLDDLQGLEKRVKDRMRELRPMLAEYQELESVARRLGLDVEEEPAQQRPARTRRTSRTQQRVSPSRRPRARAGSRRDQLLSLVQQQPGITVREAGEQLGVDGTSLYRVVRRLEQEGAVKKEGTHLQPSEAAQPAEES
jgi:transcriptional regulator of acetoin/glycerol metabolism